MATINEKTTHCAIITQEGKTYSEEGIEHVRKDLAAMYNVDIENLVVTQGKIYNNPKLFKTFLNDHPNTYIVVSAADSVDYIDPKELHKVIDSLDTAEKLDHTVWKCLRILIGRESYKFT